jgi:hypothetical protein
VAGYFYYIATYAVNIPYLDDYDAILKYILTFQNASVWDKIKSLFLPHNEHIMVMTRGMSWVGYGLTGKIDFGNLLIIGNGLLLIELVFLYRLFTPSLRFSPLYFLLIVGIFLNPQYSPTSFWAMALWSNIWVLLPVALSIFVLSNPKTWHWSLPVAVLALFSNGNGLMIWPVGFFILFLDKRPWMQYVMWGFTAVLACGIYFYLVRQQPSSGIFELSNLPLLPLNILAFLGAYGALLGGKLGQVMAVGVGIIVVVTSFFTLKKYLKTHERTDLILLSFIAFILLTALAVALFRAEKGMGIVIGGRYRQYSSLAVAVSFLMGFRLLTFQPNRGMKVLTWAIVGAVTGLSFYRDIGLRRTTEWRTVADYYNVLHNQIDVYTTDGTPRFGKTALAAQKAGLYVISPIYDLRNQLTIATRLPFQANPQIQRKEETKADGVTCGNYWLIEEPLLNFPTASNEAIYLVLTNGSQNIIFPTASTRNSLRDMLQQRRYFKKGLEAEAYDCVQSLKDYHINWLKTGKKPVLYVTNTTIFAP